VTSRAACTVRQTTAADFDAIIALTRDVYPGAPAWSETQLASHLALFPEGQLVAVDDDTGRVLGMAASLVVRWDEYDPNMPWRSFTDGGMFTNHDPEHGRTLYGAEVMVDPAARGMGVGTALYAAREALARRLGLARIRAGARLRDYHLHADRLSPQEYVDAVVRGDLCDRTLSFQLNRGFHVLGIVSDYLRHDPESRGYAAIIEWLNPAVDPMAASARHSLRTTP
jgi:GNAT superfamily N-acetyltransferase